ncbi:MAG: sensor histidine kinase [Candidatus Coproplasma sp.]
MKFSDKLKKIPFLTVGLIIVMLTGFLFLWLSCKDNAQATAAMNIRVSFQGEYRIADEEFKPLTCGEKIPADRGDLTLRGYFQLQLSDDVVIGRVPKGFIIAMYFNHIGATLYIDGQEPHMFDSEIKSLSRDSCGQVWITYAYTGDENQEVTLVLHNPHAFGNVTAYNDFLDNMYVYSEVAFENMMTNEGAFDRGVGFVFIIVGLVLLGVALYAALLRLKQGSLIMNYGLITFFAGAYFIFGAKNVNVWNNLVVFNTSALILSSMLFAVFLSSLAVSLLTGKIKTVGKAAVGASGLSAFVLMLVVLFSDLLFYDIRFIWGIIQCTVSLILLALIIISFNGKRDKNLFLLLPCALSFAAYCLDFVSIAFGWWAEGAASKIAFCITLLVALVLVLRIMPHNIRAAMREKELIAERNKLQAELQESRVSIMLSQIQPHFLYNTLNTIYHLCGKDADTARNAISSFSDYLRNNLDSIDCNELIVFEKELQHVKTYLELESIRFGDELTVFYDIRVSGFLLPILTIQPLVENAVKHGTSKKRGGGSVTVGTRERENCYEVIVSDTGAGFDTERYAEDGKKHVGIENVRQRLKTMCGGTLDIVSEVDKGTTATVKIPKREAD